MSRTFPGTFSVSLCLQHPVDILCSFYSRPLYASLSCPPKGFLNTPLLSKETSSLPWGHTPAPRSPFQSSLSAACLSRPQSFLPPGSLHTPTPHHSTAALITCFSHFSHSHWYTASLCTGSSHCLRDGNHSRPGHLFLILFQPCST